MAPPFVSARSVGEQPGDAGLLAGEGTQRDALLAGDELDVLVRRRELLRVRDERHFQAGNADDLLEELREMVLLDAEDRPRGPHDDEQAVEALVQHCSMHGSAELARFLGRLALDHLAAQVAVARLDGVTHGTKLTPRGPRSILV